MQTRYTNTSNKNKTVCELVTLTPAQGGLGIPNLTTEAPQQYSASKISTKQHAESIKFQSEIMNTNLQLVEELKRDLRTLKAENTKSKIESIDVSLNPELLRLTQQARDKGASSWLNAIPLKDQGLTLNKQKFRDFLRLRYNLPLQDLPSTRACGEPFDVSHGLSCKKGGGAVAQRHDGVRNLLNFLLSKVCKNVQVEPHLQPLDNEVMNLRSATTSSDARLDVKAGGFWSHGVTSFFSNSIFDVRVTYVNSKTNQGKPAAAISFKEQESKKKRKYQKRVLEVEMGSFSPTYSWNQRRDGRRMQNVHEAFSDGRIWQRRTLKAIHLLLTGSGPGILSIFKSL